MEQAHGWTDPAIANAAVNDPGTSTFDLLAICMAQPQCRAAAAMHPNADVNLLNWIAGQDEPVAAAMAASRLAQPQVQFQPAPAQPVHPTATGPQQPLDKGRRTKIAIWSGVGVLLVAVAVVAATLVVPRLFNSGVYKYAPDLRELPGLVSVDARSGLPKDGNNWTTDLWEAPEAGYVIASNSTSAYTDYQSALSSYNDAVFALKQWESAYQSGYASAQTCLTASTDSLYYDTRAEYCLDNLYEYLSSEDGGAVVGFIDAANGMPSSPDSPSDRSYLPPQVPAKPTEPTIGGNLVGIDLKSGKAAWTVELSAIWNDAHPQLSSVYPSGDKALLVLDDLGGSGSEAPRSQKIAVLDLKTGVVGPTAMLDGDRAQVVALHGDLTILVNQDGALRAVSTADLSTQKWTSPAHPFWWSSDESPYWISEIPGGYLLTDDGYIRISDGQRADFGRDAGQDSIQLGPLPGTRDQLIRLQGTEDGFNVSGFDPGKDEQTWRLSGVDSEVRMAGGLLIATAKNQISAYQINGKDLDRQWKYSCDDSCGVRFADDSRVVIREWTSMKVDILKTATGDKIESLNNPDENDPMMGTSILYLEQDHRMVARDLSKDGLPTLWRSIPFDGSLRQVGDQLVIESQDSGKLGIIGLDGDDWEDFRLKEG